VACAIWALLVGLGAYFAGPSITDVLGDLGVYGLIALGVLAVALGLASWLRRRRRPAAS
jgi:membrane protein DedA with SNARE-associated domain